MSNEIQRLHKVCQVKDQAIKDAAIKLRVVAYALLKQSPDAINIDDLLAFAENLEANLG